MTRARASRYAVLIRVTLHDPVHSVDCEEPLLSASRRLADRYSLQKC
jgi:hypothetical protein